MTIPALRTLSGRVTRGYYACVHCDNDPCSRRIRKICYVGHRRWLPHDHPRGEKKDYDGQIETREKPQEFSTTRLMQQLERVKHVKPGKHLNNNKRKRDANDGQCWKKRPCLWDLLYWIDLKLRHNLDTSKKIFVSTSLVHFLLFYESPRTALVLGFISRTWA
jgi:hypothetical protein